MKLFSFPGSNSETGCPLTITEEATRYGVRFMHFMYTDAPCTVAYRPASSNKNCKMLEIAVAYKHPNDQYCKKTGASIAAERMLAGNSIFMPLRGRDNYDTMYQLNQVFGNL